MRKLLSLGMALVLLAGFLGGCGPQPTPEKVVVKETVPVPVKETVIVPATAAPAAGQAAAGPVTLKVFNPTGAFEVTQTFAPRVKDLNGCTVCEITNGSWEADRTFALIRELLQKQFPTIKIITYDQFPKLLTGSDVPGLEDAVKAKGCQAAIVGNAGWGSCSTAVGRGAARIEKLGIPTMAVTRGGFTQIVANAFAGLGFPAEAPTVYEFPIPMFDKGSDLTPLRENIDKIVYGLTQWQPKITTKGVVLPAMVTVQGKDYQDALNNLNTLFIKNMWSDGLPFVPPTEERVNWILTGTDLPRDSVIAKAVVPRGGIATVESIAVALAMAGGRPEYLPVLIAAVQAITDPAFGLQALNPTTCSVIPAIIVSGPIAKQIRLGSGYGMLGPDPQHPGGQAIGRALRIIQQDLGGAVAGVGTMAIYGGMRATNAVFAEDEEGLPKGWPSLAEDWGFPKGTNLVTATPISSMVNVLWSFGTKEANDKTLMMMAKVMATPNRNAWIATPEVWNSPNHATGVVLIPRGFAASLADTSGYSKLDVKTFLWKNSKLPWSVAVATGLDANAKNYGLPEGQDIPITPNAKDMMLVVAGGDQSGHGYWMQEGHSNYTVTSQEIKLPKNWDALLKQAETDLGPLPASH